MTDEEKREAARQEAQRAKDFPFAEAAQGAHEWALLGWYTYQKWTCQYCGVRQTMPDANKFYEEGICEECKKTTRIKERGCNYLLASFPIHTFLGDDTKH